MTATILAAAWIIASIASSLDALRSGTLSETSFLSGLSRASNIIIVSIVKSRVCALSLNLLPFHGSVSKHFIRSRTLEEQPKTTETFPGTAPHREVRS